MLEGDVGGWVLLMIFVDDFCFSIKPNDFHKKSRFVCQFLDVKNC